MISTSQDKQKQTERPTEIVIEMLSAIDDLEINKVIEKINKIYDNGISQIYFQEILTKQGANECEPY